tara:strand:+ start:803 stop:1177 length:375 start_codon:yes stop_codon:yes gene_type:complete
VDEMTEKKVISDKSALFALQEPTLHYIKVAPDQEEYLKVWVKEPTWLETEKALNSVMKIDTKTQNLDIDLNAMYRYMMDNFISKTEPSLSTIDMLKLSPYVGNQIKEILPNPMMLMQEDEEKKE